MNLLQGKKGGSKLINLQRALVILFAICAFIFTAINIYSSPTSEEYQEYEEYIDTRTIYDEDFLQEAREILSQRVRKDSRRLKSDHGLNRLYAFKAAVTGSSSDCDLSYDSEECLEDMAGLKELSNIGIGRCKEIDSEEGKLLCEALENNCPLDLKQSSLVVRIACEGFLSLDFQKIMQELQKVYDEGEIDRRDYEENIEEWKQSLAYFSVFKTNRVSICLDLLEEQPYYKIVGCYILASLFPQDIIDRYARDFAYYFNAGIDKNLDPDQICEEITSVYAGNKCKEGVSFEVFIDDYFLGKRN